MVPFLALYLLDVGPNRLQVLSALQKRLKLSSAEVIEKVKTLPTKISDGDVNVLFNLQKQFESLGAKVEVAPA